MCSINVKVKVAVFILPRTLKIWCALLHNAIRTHHSSALLMLQCTIYFSRTIETNYLRFTCEFYTLRNNTLIHTIWFLKHFWEIESDISKWWKNRLNDFAITCALCKTCSCYKFCLISVSVKYCCITISLNKTEIVLCFKSLRLLFWMGHNFKWKTPLARGCAIYIKEDCNACDVMYSKMWCL